MELLDGPALRPEGEVDFPVELQRAGKAVLSNSSGALLYCPSMFLTFVASFEGPGEEESRGDKPLRNDCILLERKEAGLEIREGPDGLGSRGGAALEALASIEFAEPPARMAEFTFSLTSGRRENFSGYLGPLD